VNREPLGPQPTAGPPRRWPAHAPRLGGRTPWRDPLHIRRPDGYDAATDGGGDPRTAWLERGADHGGPGGAAGSESGGTAEDRRSAPATPRSPAGPHRAVRTRGCRRAPLPGPGRCHRGGRRAWRPGPARDAAGAAPSPSGDGAAPAVRRA